MPREKIQRKIKKKPVYRYFKPRGIPMSKLDDVTITYEEFEVIRLVDYENYPQKEAAIELGISQPVVSRVIHRAHRKIAEALIHGYAIKINIGDTPVHILYKDVKCKSCGTEYEAPYDDNEGIYCPECRKKTGVQKK